MGPVNFPQVLISTGYHSEQSTLCLLSSWVSLIQSENPDFLLCDYAPSAALAAAAIGVKYARIGTGYTVPPIDFFSRMRYCNNTSASREADEDARRVLSFVNRAFSEIGFKANLEEMVWKASTIDILRTVAAFDHYENRSGAYRYFGVWPSTISNCLPVFSAHGMRCFAYLKDFSAFPKLLRLVSDHVSEVILYSPNLSESSRAHLNRMRNVQISSVPIRLDQLAGTCDCVITNGGHNTTLYALSLGIPVAVVSTNGEQAITGEIAARNRVGTWVRVNQPSDFERFATSIPKLVDFCKKQQFTGHQFASVENPIAAISEAVYELM